MHINESSENYLESILMLAMEKDQVRSIDVVNKMNYSKPSISIAMKRLREEGKITMDESGHIYLTEEGEAIARKILERHEFFRRFLVTMGVSEDIAEEEACRIEHDISQETFEIIRTYVQKKGLM